MNSTECQGTDVLPPCQESLTVLNTELVFVDAPANLEGAAAHCGSLGAEVANYPNRTDVQELIGEEIQNCFKMVGDEMVAECRADRNWMHFAIPSSSDPAASKSLLEDEGSSHGELSYFCQRDIDIGNSAYSDLITVVICLSALLGLFLIYFGYLWNKRRIAAKNVIRRQGCSGPMEYVGMERPIPVGNVIELPEYHEIVVRRGPGHNPYPPIRPSENFYRELAPIEEADEPSETVVEIDEPSEIVEASDGPSEIVEASDEEFLDLPSTGKPQSPIKSNPWPVHRLVFSPQKPASDYRRSRSLGRNANADSHVIEIYRNIKKQQEEDEDTHEV